MHSEPLQVRANLERADGLIQTAAEAGAELIVLPEMFNTGYGLCPDYGPYAEDLAGPTIRLLSERSRQWKRAIAAGFVEHADHHLYDSLVFCSPDGDISVYRKRRLVFWERFRFYPGRSPLIVKTRLGRIGFAICADMIYQRVWDEYRDRIDIAVIAAAWPEFSCRFTGKSHWLLGKVGPMSGEIPEKVAGDLGIPVVFANQCGETHTQIPILRSRIRDRFSGKSCLADGRHGLKAKAGSEERVLIGELTAHSPKGLKTWHSMYPLASAEFSSTLALASSESAAALSTGAPSVAAP